MNDFEVIVNTKEVVEMGCKWEVEEKSNKYIIGIKSMDGNFCPICEVEAPFFSDAEFIMDALKSYMPDPNKYFTEILPGQMKKIKSCD